MSGTHMKAVYTRTRTAGAEDVAVTTHDFWCEGGDSSDANCDTIAAAFITFWDGLVAAAYISDAVKLTELRFYKGYNGDGSPGAVDYVKTYVKPGTAQPMLPPQVACNITELTDWRKHWGRFYLPGIVASSANTLNADGTYKTTFISTIATAAQTMYNAWGHITNHTPVVWGHVTGDMNYAAVAPPRWMPSWFGLGSGSGTVGIGALSVQAIRVDEIPDIQRRRRYESTQVRNTKQLS